MIASAAFGVSSSPFHMTPASSEPVSTCRRSSLTEVRLAVAIKQDMVNIVEDASELGRILDALHLAAGLVVLSSTVLTADRSDHQLDVAVPHIAATYGHDRTRKTKGSQIDAGAPPAPAAPRRFSARPRLGTGFRAQLDLFCSDHALPSVLLVQLLEHAAAAVRTW